MKAQEKTITSKETRKVLVPYFYDEFTCIGNGCPETCCQRWRIDIDKNTYNLYRNIKDPKFKKEMPNRVKRNKNPNNDNDYAQIVLNEDEGCPYLENGLCSIQLKYGHKYLSVTCRIFPRNNLQNIGGTAEGSLSMACFETIRLGLFPETPITFKEIEMLKDHKNIVTMLPIANMPTNTPLPQYVREIRQTLIDIMQVRTLALSDRLFIVGMLLKKLSALTEENASMALIACSTFLKAAINGEFNGTVASLSDNPDIKLNMKTLIVKNILGKDAFSKFRENLSAWLNKKYGALTQASFDNTESFIEQKVAQNWQGILSKRGHVIENYLVNYIFRFALPFKDPSELTIAQNFILLAEQYALMRIYLSCCADENGEISDADLASFIVYLDRSFSHGSSAVNMAKKYIDAGYDDIGYISFLLRD